ncbi:hypothetical protein E4U46_007586 [Claviceps purpurea]|nr:hypothetical protein E4U46_007586 [Claviceps purpurea]
MTTKSSPSQDHPSHPRPSMPSEQPLPNRFEKRLRSKLHEGWQAICIGTALCDFCDKQSRGVVQKCVKCGLSICSPCSSCGALRGNRNHRLDHDAVCWDRHAVETRRYKRGGAAKMVKRARRVRRGRVSGEEGEAAVDSPRPRRRRQGGREEEEDNREEGGEVAGGGAPCLGMYSGRWLEKATQTPGWWVPERSRGVLLPPMDSICPPRCHRADEKDAASILAGMPLWGAEPCERTMLDGRCRRGVDNAWCRFGGPQAETILSREGVHNPEKNCFVSGKAGHCARASPAGLGDPLRTRPFTPIYGATTPSFTRDLCS